MQLTIYHNEDRNQRVEPEVVSFTFDATKQQLSYWPKKSDGTAGVGVVLHGVTWIKATS